MKHYTIYDIGQLILIGGEAADNLHILCWHCFGETNPSKRMAFPLLHLRSNNHRANLKELLINNLTIHHKAQSEIAERRLCRNLSL